MTIRPPGGVASAEFTTRLTSSCSICTGSTRTGCTPDPSSSCELDVVSDQAREDRAEVLDEAVELGRARLEHLAPAEREQLSGEGGRAIRGTVDLVGVMVLDAPRRDMREQQLRVAADRGEQVVEVVCDAAGEPADALEPLRAPQVALELLALRHVAQHGDVQARQDVRACCELRLAHGAVGSHDLGLLGQLRRRPWRAARRACGRRARRPRDWRRRIALRRSR